MGQAYEFKCSNCEYSVTTSGKLDWGFLAVVNTYVCSDCKEVVDVQVGEYGKVIQPEDLNEEQKKEFYRCPECRGKNIILWDSLKYLCPICGGKMIKDEFSHICWD